MLLAYFIYPYDDLPFSIVSEIKGKKKKKIKAPRVQDALPQNKISVSGLGDSSPAISTAAANTNSEREQIFIKKLD